MASELLPDDEASPLEWARLYRAVGWVPLPIRGYDDFPEFAEQLRRASPLIIEDEIERKCKASLKHPMVQWRRGRDWIAQPPTDEEMVAWWADHPDRGIFLLTGPGSGLTAIDVDTYKGADPSTWEPLATVVASTTRGGLHLIFAEAAAKTVEDWPVKGVDIRGTGGGFVAPAGTGSAGRRFLRWELPLAPYPLPVEPPRAAPPTPTAGGFSFRMKPEPARAGSFVDVVSTPRPDGSKNMSAKEIVGMLCRPIALPPDALGAALGLLDDIDPALRDAVRPGWRDALTSTRPRSEEFVTQFLCTWNDLRCDPPWGPEKVAEVASSLWRSSTSSYREPAETPPAPPGPSAGLGPDDAPSGAPPGATEPEHDRVFEEFAAACPPRADTCTIDYYLSNRRRRLMSCEKLPPNLNASGLFDLGPKFGTGLGPWLNNAIGRGIAPGFFGALVAKKAKAGKTAFIDQWLTGLVMQGAQSYLDAKAGKPHGPIFQLWTVSEMSDEDLDERALARYIGCDQGMLRAGDSAYDSDWAKARAAELGLSREAVVEQLFAQVGAILAGDSLFMMARRLTRQVNVDRFPEDDPTRGLKSCQNGPMLVRTLEVGIHNARARLAKDAGVPLEDVWPILFVDPIHRFIDPTAGDITGVDQLANALRQFSKRTGTIVFITCDTNKASATEVAPKKGEAKLTAAAEFAGAVRGSYSLCHLPDVGMLLKTEPCEREPGSPPKRRARISLGFSRGSPAEESDYEFDYYPASGRFVAIAPPAVQQGPTTPGTGAPAGPTLSFSPVETAESKKASIAKARAAKLAKTEEPPS